MPRLTDIGIIIRPHVDVAADVGSVPLRHVLLPARVAAVLGISVMQALQISFVV
jgi:hypothetical protein